MCELVRVVYLFRHQPFVHLLHFAFCVPLLSLRYVQQLLAHLSLRLLHKFALETSLGIFVPQPLLVIHLWFERHTLRLFVHGLVVFVSAIRSHLTLGVNSFKFLLVDMKPVLKNLAHRYILVIVFAILLVNQPVHVVISFLISLLDFVV